MGLNEIQIDNTLKYNRYANNNPVLTQQPL